MGRNRRIQRIFPDGIDPTRAEHQLILTPRCPLLPKIIRRHARSVSSCISHHNRFPLYCYLISSRTISFHTGNGKWDNGARQGTRYQFMLDHIKGILAWAFIGTRNGKCLRECSWTHWFGGEREKYSSFFLPLHFKSAGRQPPFFASS